MARTARPRLPDDLAKELRGAIRGALVRKGLKVTDLCEASRGRREVDERTMWRYFSPQDTLARDVAFDLILRCKNKGITLPSAVVEEVYAEEVTPAIVIFPGEGERLARRLAQEAARMLSLDKRTAGRLVELFADFLTPYERFNQTSLGRGILHTIRSNWQPGTWRQRLHTLRFANVDPDGASYVEPSPMKLIEMAATKGVRK